MGSFHKLTWISYLDPVSNLAGLVLVKLATRRGVRSCLGKTLRSACQPIGSETMVQICKSIMIAQWRMIKSHYLSSTWPGSWLLSEAWIKLTVLSLHPWFNSQPWRSNSRDVSLVNHTLPTCPDSAWQKMAWSHLYRCIPVLTTEIWEKFSAVSKRMHLPIGATQPKEGWSSTINRW